MLSPEMDPGCLCGEVHRVGLERVMQGEEKVVLMVRFGGVAVVCCALLALLLVVVVASLLKSRPELA